eukprot:56502-Chlamydomonas_euryale.AAC.3
MPVPDTMSCRCLTHAGADFSPTTLSKDTVKGQRLSTHEMEMLSLHHRGAYNLRATSATDTQMLHDPAAGRCNLRVAAAIRSLAATAIRS